MNYYIDTNNGRNEVCCPLAAAVAVADYMACAKLIRRGATVHIKTIAFAADLYTRRIPVQDVWLMPPSANYIPRRTVEHVWLSWRKVVLDLLYKYGKEVS